MEGGLGAYCAPYHDQAPYSLVYGEQHLAHVRKNNYCRYVAYRHTGRETKAAA